MKKYLPVLIFMLPVLSLSAQRKEEKMVYFKDLDGFSGYVTFEVSYNGYAGVLAGKKGVLVLEKYDASSEDLKALLKAGYDLRGFPESGYTPEHYAFVVQGQAKIGIISFYGGTDNVAKGLSKLQLGESLGDYTTPEFEESMKEAARKWQQKNKKNHWEESGSFTDLEVTQLYISEFEETIRKILGKAAKERKIENANDAVNEAQKAMMYGNLPRAKSLLEKAYKLDPKNERMIQASKEYAVKKKEKDEKDLQNMMIEAELARQERERNQAAAEAKEIRTLRSWKVGSPANFSPQNQARLNELTKRETARNLARINDMFEAGRERIRERSRQRLAQINAEYERSIAELHEKFAREKRETIADTKRKKERIKAEKFRSEENRLSKYGYRKGESDAEMRANVRKMAAEIPPGRFNDGLAPLKYFKYGYVNKNGDIVVPFKYDRTGSFHNGLASVGYEDLYLGDLYEEWNRRFGYINTSGKVVVPLIYDQTSIFTDGYGIVERNNKVGAVNASGTLIIPVEYQFINYAGEGLVKVKKNNKFGFLDQRTGKPVIPLQYDQALYFREGLVGVKSKGKWGFLDAKGRVVIPFNFDDVKNAGFQNGIASVVEAGVTTKINRFGNRIDFNTLLVHLSEGMIPVRHQDNKYSDFKYGFVNEDYQLVVPPLYDEYKKFQDGVAMVEKDNKWGGIDRNGDVVIPFKYKDIGYRFYSGLLAVTEESGKWGYIDKYGKEVIPLKYDKVNSFWEGAGLAVVKKEGKYGLIDTRGKTKIPFKYDDMSATEITRLNLISVKRNGKIGFLNARGKTIIPIIYDKVLSSFYNRNVAKLMKDGKQGFFNAKGEEIIEVKYDDIAAFENGLARALLNGRYGFIDSSGNAVIPFKYDTAYNFMKGFAEVRSGNKTFILNKKGEIQEGKEFIRISDFSEGIAMVMQHGKYGYIDQNNQLVTPFKYDFLRFFQDGMGMVGIEKDKYSRVYGFIDSTGKEVIPVKYDNFDSRTGKYFGIYYFEDGLVQAELNEKHGYVNKQGKEVIPVIYYEVGNFSEGLVRVYNQGVDGFPREQQNKWAYFDLKGKKVTEFRFTRARDFSDGYAYVETADGAGFIDHSGKEVIPVSKKYKRIDDFIGGVAVAYNGEAWGFINKNSKEVLPFEYSGVNSGNGYLVLRKGNKDGVVDTHGKTVLPFKYNRLSLELGGGISNERVTEYVISIESGKWGLIRLPDGKQIASNRFDYINRFNGNELTTFRTGNKWGILALDGREILPAEYEEIKNYGDAGCLAVRYNGKWGVVNNFGDVVIPLKYESVYISVNGTKKKIVAVKQAGEPDAYELTNFEIIPK